MIPPISFRLSPMIDNFFAIAVSESLKVALPR